MFIVVSCLFVLAALAQSEVFDKVDVMPTFKEGDLNQWISRNLTYPAIAAENNIQGKVIVCFVVERDGSISDVQVVRSVDPALDREAVRVVKCMPKWNPGRHNGKRVRVKFTLPINFRFTVEEKDLKTEPAKFD